MTRAFLRRILLAAACAATGAAVAQVDYGDKKQRNPTGDPAVEKGFQDTKKQIEDRRKPPEPTTEPPKQSTGTEKGGEPYGKDWMERQLGTEGKTRTW